MAITVEDPEMVNWFPTDSRGRPILGPDYADREVKIAVIETRPKSDD